MMLAKLFGGKTTVTVLESDLLDSIRVSTIPDPQMLRERLATLHAQIDAAEREWEALDARASDPRAFLARQPVAETLQQLREKAAPLPAAIESAERRRAAFLSLAASVCRKSAALEAMKRVSTRNSWPNTSRKRAT